MLIATIVPNNTTNKNITWTSSNPNVASVDSNSLVKGIKEGTSLIVVITKNGKVASCQIKVNKIEETKNESN